MKVYYVATVSNHETEELSDNVDIEIYKEKEVAEARLAEIADEYGLILNGNSATPEEYEYDGSYEAFLSEQEI